MSILDKPHRFLGLPYVTVGALVYEIRALGFPLTKNRFYILEKRLPFPTSKKSVGGWRKYNHKNADIIKRLILEDYGQDDDFGIPELQLDK